MHVILAGFFNTEDWAENEDQQYNEIVETYNIVSPAQFRGLYSYPDDRPDPRRVASETLSNEERIALRDKLTYTQSRYCRLNFMTETEASADKWLTADEAAAACGLTSSLIDNRKLVDECVRINMLKVRLDGTKELIASADFAQWKTDMEARQRALHPTSSQPAWRQKQAA